MDSNFQTALVAVLNAARALQAGCPLTMVPEGAPVRPFLAQLYSAIDAVDAVGEYVPDCLNLVYTASGAGDVLAHPCLRAAGTCTAVWSVGARQCPECRGDLPRATMAPVALDRDRPGFCQGDPTCWRQPDLPGGTCHHHSPAAALPSTRVVRRDPSFTDAQEA